jgi:predicted RNA-binding Zn-ribbon protein involved in translation (DUF1610 family)
MTADLRANARIEPIAFDCPSCGAKYIIETIEVPNLEVGIGAGR